VETTDVKGSLELLRKVIEGYKGVFKGEEITKILSGLTCKPDAEKIGGVSVDHIALDLSKVTGDNPDAKGVVDTIQKVLGKEGVLVRLAPAGEKYVVVSLGGGAARMEQVMKDAASGKSPLLENPGVMKDSKKLPEKRIFELYLAVDQLLKVVKTITGSANVPGMAKIDAPLAIALSAEKNYGRLDLVLPTELIIEIKNVVLQAMFGGGFGGGGGGGSAPSF
jgi:hypothetical protein